MLAFFFPLHFFHGYISTNAIPQQLCPAARPRWRSWDVSAQWGPCPSSVSAAACSPLPSQHPKPQHLRLAATIYTRACIIINKLGVQVRAHICSSTRYYRAINSLALKMLNTLNRCTGSFFQGPFPVLSLGCHLGGPMVNAGPTSIYNCRFAENILFCCCTHSTPGREGKEEETLHS